MFKPNINWLFLFIPITLALFVAPVLVLSSYFIAPTFLHPSFNGLSLGFVLLAVLLGAMVSGDGRANWYKGVQLIVGSGRVDSFDRSSRITQQPKR
jgi:calcium/proton exchanger cax